MLQIHERHDTKGYEDKIKAIDNDYLLIVESVTDNGVNGYGIFAADENGITIYDYDGEGLDVIDGVIRTILFKGLLAGINECSFDIKDKGKNKTLIKLGFFKKNINRIDDINFFMNNCKKCKESK